MKSNNIHSSHPDVLEAFRCPARPSLGFRFTEAEERAMAVAIRKSRQFMRTYGQGREPYMLDRRNYECGQI